MSFALVRRTLAAWLAASAAVLLCSHAALSQESAAAAPTQTLKTSFARLSDSFADADSAPPQQSQSLTQTPSRPATPYVPLTPGGKMRRAFRKAFLSPEGYLRTGISAAITQAGERDQPHKSAGDEFADGLSRFAIKTGTRYTRTVLGSGVFPVLFRQDPRYDRSEKKNVGRRALHAVSRVFVTRGDDGRLQPNYSRWAGSLSSSALSNLWERSTPGRDRVGVDATFRRFGSSLIGDAWQLVLFSEFGPDIFRVFRR